jgi:hypothetical protein
MGASAAVIVWRDIVGKMSFQPMMSGAFQLILSPLLSH